MTLSPKINSIILMFSRSIIFQKIKPPKKIPKNKIRVKSTCKFVLIDIPWFKMQFFTMSDSETWIRMKSGLIEQDTASFETSIKHWFRVKPKICHLSQKRKFSGWQTRAQKISRREDHSSRNILTRFSM